MDVWNGETMDKAMRKLIRIFVLIVVVCACGRAAQAAPTCPLWCILPPDPPPPLTPMPTDDPPLRPMLSTAPNTGGGNTATAAPAVAARASIVGKKVAGGACKNAKLEGTLEEKDGKFMCNFAPSTLKVGAACHAMDKIGAVTVLDGKRYCKLPE